MNEHPLTLTEHEGMLLALIIRTQPTTAHQLHKVFESSPVSSINASKGQLYPAIRRLKSRELLIATPISSDARGTEELQITERGVAAVRDWVQNISESHVVLDDPLRTRVLSLEIMSKDEQLRWIAKAKSLVKAKREIVETYNESVDVPHQTFAYHSVMQALAAKMETLDELLYEIASSS